MATEERDWERFFSGVDLSGLERLGSSWQEQEDVLSEANEKEKKYTIRNGTVDLEMFLNKAGINVLAWEANLPDYLTPGGTSTDFMEFKEWILGKFPAMLYPDGRNPYQFKRSYRPFSKVEYTFGSGEVKSYPLGDVRRDKNLEIDFLNRWEEVEHTFIIGNETPRVSDYSYMLRIGKPRAGQTQIALFLRNTQYTLNAWNPAVLSWVLGTHVRAGVLGELGAEARDLAGLVQAKAQESLHLNSS